MCLSGLLLLIAPKARAMKATRHRGFGRISYLDGNVSFQPTETEDWAAAAKNRPVTVGDKLWTIRIPPRGAAGGAGVLALGQHDGALLLEPGRKTSCKCVSPKEQSIFACAN